MLKKNERNNPSVTAIISFIFSLVTLVISVLLTVLILVMMAWWSQRSGFHGAPIGFILPIYGYLFIALPAAGITVLIAVIPTKGKHWPLAVCSLRIVAMSVIMPVLPVLISFIAGMLFF